MQPGPMGLLCFIFLNFLNVFAAFLVIIIKVLSYFYHPSIVQFV